MLMSRPGTSQRIDMEGTPEVVGYEARLADTLRSLRDMIRRRWLTLFLVTAAVVAIGATLIMLMTPKYEAVARIQIDPSRNPLSSASNDVASLASEAIETEVTVLNSEDLARQVVKQLNLQNDPEFTRGLAPAEGAPPLTNEERISAVAGKVQRQLSVGRDRLTYVINIRFKANDADKAAKVANTYAETYINSKVGSRMGTAERQAAFFRQRLDELGREVRAADQAVAQYRAQAGIVAQGQGSTTIADQQVAPLSTQLATAESEAAEARSNLAAARAQIARGGLDAVSEVRSSPVISDLRRQRAEVLRNMGEVSARYGERHPESVKVREQLAGLDEQIKAEAQRAVSSLEAAAGAAQARATSLRGTLHGLEGQQARNTRASATAETLEREAQSKRAAYDKIAELSLQSTQASRNEISQATIVDRAVAPVRPTSPNRPLLLALTLIVALAAGGTTVIVQELLVSGIRSVGDFENQFGIPVLAALPRVKHASPADLIADRRTSLYAESLRIARAAIFGTRGVTPPKVIAITSALPDEGKTTTSAAFARVLALSGQRTLLIDCDLRRAAMRMIVPTGESAGLIALLNGSAAIEQAIVKDRVENLDVVLVTAPHFATDDLFGGDRLKTLLATLSPHYDTILLDLPPLVGLADGRTLATMADATILVVKWGSTPAAPIDSALGWLRADGANAIGALFTMVDPSAEALGGMYYSKKYGAYYQPE
ncbi:polysaccharide biosynthesis tyrosine autokinase [Sphingosinicella sp. BN140058]|nr:polysaccharide biosynthesis tyrosine autokinase [Sphingosinicella sp. BN140058]